MQDHHATTCGVHVEGAFRSKVSIQSKSKNLVTVRTFGTSTSKVTALTRMAHAMRPMRNARERLRTLSKACGRLQTQNARVTSWTLDPWNPNSQHGNPPARHSKTNSIPNDELTNKRHNTNPTKQPKEAAGGWAKLTRVLNPAECAGSNGVLSLLHQVPVYQGAALPKCFLSYCTFSQYAISSTSCR